MFYKINVIFGQTFQIIDFALIFAQNAIGIDNRPWVDLTMKKRFAQIF
jgi:hypothetical protein